ncbi:MAG TPA: glycosyl transferase family 90 [Rhizomicrobium sp.]|nr:glycosyl transferase family 90 [Rhizomicrobium sp.]
MPDTITITADFVPDRSQLLARDLSYHLGDRERYDVHAIEPATSSHPAPDDQFVSFRLGARRFFCGEDFRQHCKISADGVTEHGDALSVMQNRAVSMINRDIADMDPDVAYAFDLSDGCRHDYAAHFETAKPIPVFQHSRLKGVAAMIHPLPGFQTFPSRYFRDPGDTTPFLEKQSKIFWRGKLTGFIETSRGYARPRGVATDRKRSEDEKIALFRTLTRFRICTDFGNDDRLDAGLVPTKNKGDFSVGIPFLEPLYKPHAEIEDHLHYRYLLALDGNDYPSSLYWMLNTNSVVMRQGSPWETFADCYFEPWVHYVPLAHDGSDLMDKFEWCEAHTEECQRISANARRAWNVLFNIEYQIERRRNALRTYNSWFK